MNKARAIQIIENDFKMGCSCCMHPSEVGWCDNKCQSKKAINMAIEALSKDVVSREEYDKLLQEKINFANATIDNTQYEWIVEHSGNGWDDWENLICPKCGEKHERVPYHYNFCPDCGERMKVNKNRQKRNKHERIY